MAKEECEQNYILIWQDTTPKTVQFVETNGLKIAIFERRIIEKNPSFSLLISVPSPFCVIIEPSKEDSGHRRRPGKRRKGERF